MGIGNASETRFAYIVEATENTTPTTPAFTNLRIVSESLGYQKQTIPSNEQRPDRNVAYMADVGFTVGGDVNFELSYATFDALLESLLQAAWDDDVLVNGVTPKSFTFEKTFELGTTDSYFRFTGCQVNSMSLNIAARELITGTFNILGRGHSKPGAAIISGATYADPNENLVMNGSNDVGTITTTGAGTPKLQSISLNITNNLADRPQVGQRGSAGTRSGRFVVTGNLNAYFETQEMYDAFFDHDDVVIEVTVGSVTTEKYTISLPLVKLSNGTVVAGGNDTDVMGNFDFQAIYDGTLEGTIEITREVA